jgi:hypothetical protein
MSCVFEVPVFQTCQVLPRLFILRLMKACSTMCPCRQSIKEILRDNVSNSNEIFLSRVFIELHTSREVLVHLVTELMSLHVMRKIVFHGMKSHKAHVHRIYRTSICNTAAPTSSNFVIASFPRPARLVVGANPNQQRASKGSLTSLREQIGGRHFDQSYPFVLAQDT